MAFRCIMLPESKNIPLSAWQQLQNILQSYGIKSFLYKHVSASTKKQTKGLRLEFGKGNDVRSFELFMEIMEFFEKTSLPFSFSSSFNKAVGSKKVKDVIQGNFSKNLFFKKIDKDLQHFKQQTQKVLLYKPGILF